MITAWFERLNQRERLLALAVGGLLFLLVNIAIWSAFFRMSAGARSDWAAQRSARAEQQVYLDEYKTWTKRAEWLKKNQPKLTNPAEASSLLSQVKEIASKYNVEIDNPQIGAAASTPNYQSVSATLETKSGWEPLVHMLYDAQKPEAFVAFENVNLMVDGSDPTVMR